MSNIAVLGCELEVVPPGTGTITITSQPSTDVFINNKGVYFKEIRFTVAGSNGGGSVTNNDGTGSGSIVASGADILEIPSGNLSVLEGDTSLPVNITGTAGQSSATGSVTVRVKSAGQTDVSAT